MFFLAFMEIISLPASTNLSQSSFPQNFLVLRSLHSLTPALMQVPKGKLFYAHTSDTKCVSFFLALNNSDSDCLAFIRPHRLFSPIRSFPLQAPATMSPVLLTDQLSIRVPRSPPRVPQCAARAHGIREPLSFTGLL